MAGSSMRKNRPATRGRLRDRREGLRRHLLTGARWRGAACWTECQHARRYLSRGKTVAYSPARIWTAGSDSAVSRSRSIRSVPPTATVPARAATRVSVRSCRYSGPTTGWSTREPAQRRKSADELKWAEPGSAHRGEERTGLAGRVGQSARIFSGRRRRVWLGQPHVHTGSTERLPTRN